jgi:hypothetical protein
MTTPPMLAELSEDAATGRIAEIYDEICRFSGVPYVSSLQRYLATMPGVLEWAWDALRPAMACGTIPETGWRLAQSVRLVPATTRPPATDPAATTAIRNIAENFVRVSPVNLVTGACLAHLLTGAHRAGAGYPQSWAPPDMLPPMPGNIDPQTLTSDRHAVLMRFATQVDGKPFIPALYRQLAHFPAFLAWLAAELAPRFTAPETATARNGFRTAARQVAPDIVARLPRLPPAPPPDEATTSRILATIDRYAETSPEMTMFGQLILEALAAR